MSNGSARPSPALQRAGKARCALRAVPIRHAGLAFGPSMAYQARVELLHSYSYMHISKVERQV
jgi:hypothetical protein